MEDIEYINLIEIGQVVIKMQGVKNGDLAVPLKMHFAQHVLLCQWHMTVCLDFAVVTRLSSFFRYVSEYGTLTVKY